MTATTPPADGWQIAAAKTAGHSHRAAGKPAQDAYGSRIIAGTDGYATLIAAVADGAGSAPYAEQGAAYAVARALAYLAEPAQPDPVAATICAALDLRQLAELAGHDPGDYATTLLTAVLSTSRLTVTQVGDGAVVYRAGAGQWHTALPPQRGRYANETRMLTDPDLAPAHRVIQPDDGITALAIFTDGLQNLVLQKPDYRPHVPFFEGLFGWLQQQPDADTAQQGLCRLLEAPDTRRRTADDLTILAAWGILSNGLQGHLTACSSSQLP